MPSRSPSLASRLRNALSQSPGRGSHISRSDPAPARRTRSVPPGGQRSARWLSRSSDRPDRTPGHGKTQFHFVISYLLSPLIILRQKRRSLRPEKISALLSIPFTVTSVQSFAQGQCRLVSHYHHIVVQLQDRSRDSRGDRAEEGLFHRFRLVLAGQQPLKSFSRS